MGNGDAGQHQPAHGQQQATTTLDRLTESVAAKLVVRVVLPLLTFVSIPLVVAQWNGMRGDIAAVKVTQGAQADKMAGLERQVTTIDTKLDAGLIWRLTQLERRFEAMEASVERREAQRSTTN